MKTHTSDFKNTIKTFGRELDSKITYTIGGTTTELGNEQLNSVIPHYEGAILKSVMKQLDIDSNVEIPVGTILTYQFGVKVGNSYEYISYGNYVVKEVEKQEDTMSYKITCYDKMLYSMIPYEAMSITYPITIRNYISAICTKLGLTFKNASSTFANYNKQITKELYLDSNGKDLGYTFRDVLDELAQVTASTICINETDDELEIRYINDTNDTIDEEFLKDVNVNFGEKFGAVNTIVLSRSAGADNIYYPSTLPANPIEIKISDNQIMNGNDRDTYMADIYNKLNGLEYYINDFSSTGICYYNLCDRYNVSIDGTTYSCIMFNDEVNITQGLQENIYTDMPKESVTDYTKADKTDRRINQTTLIVDKQQSEITALVDTTEDIQKEVNPTDTATGSTIYLEDSAEAPLINFELEGKTTQETRISTNYFNALAIGNANIVVSDEGQTITMPVYTSGNGYTSTHKKLKELAPDLKVGDTVYLHFSKNTELNNFIYLTNTWSNHTQRTITQNDLDATVILYGNRYQDGITEQTILTNFRIVKNQSDEWMPFGQMPSPDYPSDIVSVGYENLFSGFREISTNGTYENGVLKVSASGGGNCYSNYFIPTGNRTYYFNYISSYATARYYVAEYDSNYTQIRSVSKTAPQSFTIGNDTSYFAIIWNFTTGTTYPITISNMQLEKGASPHSYIPYGKYGLEVKTIGKNLFDGVLEQGSVNSQGINNTNTTRLRTKNYISVYPNTTYALKVNENTTGKNLQFSISYYDKNDYTTYRLSYLNWTTSNPITFTTPNDCHYIRFLIAYTDSSTINTTDNISKIQVEKTQTTPYEPYKSNTYLYTLNEPLRAIGNYKDKLYIDNGMLYVERKIGKVVLNGSEGWTKGAKTSVNRYYQRYFINSVYSANKILLYSNYFTCITQDASDDDAIGLSHLNDRGLMFNFALDDTSFDTLEKFTTWLSTHNTEVNYPLTTSVIEELGEVTIPSTYKGITYIDTTDELEPNMSIEYVRDTQITDYVEQHIAQIKVNEEGITQRVQTIEDSNYGGRISAVEQKQTDTDVTIDIISTNIDKTNGNVKEVTTETGFTFNSTGMSIKQDDFEILQTPQGAYYKEGNNVVGQYTKDGSKQKDLALFGVYYYGMKEINSTPMFVAQLYNDENGEECFGHFFNGEV